MYTTRAPAWPRVTAGKERFGLVLPWAGLSGPEAGSVGWPPEATVHVSKQNGGAVTAGSGPGSCHSLGPAPPPPCLSSLLSRVPGGCEPPIPATNTPSKPRERRPSNGRPSPAPRESRTPTQQLSHHQPGPRKRRAGRFAAGLASRWVLPGYLTCSRLLRWCPRVPSPSIPQTQGLGVGEGRLKVPACSL